MGNLDTSIDTAIEAIRDLSYAANCEWEKQGKSSDPLLNLYITSNEVMTALMKAMHSKNFNNNLETVVPIVNGAGKKIQAIKAIREYTGLGLKEAKDIADGTTKFGDYTWVSNPKMTRQDLIDDLRSFGYEVK